MKIDLFDLLCASIILAFVLATTGCTQNVLAIVTPTAEQLPEQPTSTATVLATSTPVLATETEVARITSTVLATILNVRDHSGNVVGYLVAGDSVTCIPSSSGWCALESGNVVWQGCLEHSGNLDCQEK